MKAIFIDVMYQGSRATVACAIVKDICDEIPIKEYTFDSEVQNEYIPGQFYKRELDPVIKGVERSDDNFNTIIIDGLVWLDKGKPGLGAYLYQYFKGQYNVIGIAKNPFKGNQAAKKVFRGNSRNPLWVTCEGIDSKTAVELVLKMNGQHRIPTIVKRVDQLSKKML